MSALALYILIGDILVCGGIVGLAIWLMAFRKNDKSLDEAARMPLEEPPKKV